LKELVKLTLKEWALYFDNPKTASKLLGLQKDSSYFSIQKSLITAIKRSLFDQKKK